MKTLQAQVQGHCDAKFKEVQDAFKENFEKRDEVGASVCITLNGNTVVDMWGGHKSVGGEAWDKDTVSIVFSCTKGASAICAHMAADRGLLDLDAPVAKYWPEFAQAGKENAIVSMMLDHSVGVPVIRETLKDGAYYDYEYMVGLLEREAPFWKPGTRNGYHPVTYAWTVGEMVRRSTQKRLGAFFRDEVATPLGLDFWMGLPEEHESRVAPMIFPPMDPEADTPISRALKQDPQGPTALFLFNNGGFHPNSREAHAAEIGSAGGITNARSLAGMYAPLANGGTINNVQLVGKDTLTRMSRVSVATHEDATLNVPTRLALGFMKSMDNRRLGYADPCSVILSDAAFGHAGMGGSIGFADPECSMSFAYTMNRMDPAIFISERCQALVDAAYRSLGYRNNTSGVWTT